MDLQKKPSNAIIADLLGTGLDIAKYSEKIILAHGMKGAFETCYF